jgi:malonyl-CoA O-methyltransferase
LAALEAQRREDGTLALSFEVVYGHAWKAQPKAVSQAQGVIRVEDIGRKSRGRKL